jgi:hypothetical protein
LLFGPPSLAVPVEALLPEGDGLVVAPAVDPVEPEPMLPEADEPGTIEGLRLFGPPSLAVPVEALLPEGVGVLPLAMPPPRVPDDVVLPELLIEPALACTPSESSVC